MSEIINSKQNTVNRREVLRGLLGLGGAVLIASNLPSSAEAHHGHNHADCIGTGDPNPAINPACPGTWGVDILVEGAFFVARETNNPNEEWSKEKGIWSPVKGGRRFELFLMGTSGSVRNMTALEDGNGLAFDENSPEKSKIVQYRQEGIGWDRAKLINPNTGKPEDLPVVRGQLKRYLETPKENGEKFASVYDFCLPICPIVDGQKPWAKTIYILTGLSLEVLKQRGMAKKEGMHIPESDNEMFLVQRS